VRTLLSRAVFVILLVLLPAGGWARSRSGSVHVHGYTTRSGHYVAPYTRSAPHTYTPSAPISQGHSISRMDRKGGDREARQPGQEIGARIPNELSDPREGS